MGSGITCDPEILSLSTSKGKGCGMLGGWGGAVITFEGGFYMVPLASQALSWGLGRGLGVFGDHV